MSEIAGSIRDQGKAILIMMAVAIISVLGMVILGALQPVIGSINELGPDNITGIANYSIQILLTAFIGGFALTGSFASITVLIIVVKVIIGVVKGLKS